MDTDTSDVQAALRGEIGREIERVATTTGKFLDDLIGNGRWFATLAVAEVAGLSKVVATVSGWRFALLIFGVAWLAVAVGALILSIRRSQDVKDKIQGGVATILLDLPGVEVTDRNAVVRQLAELKDVVTATTIDTEQQARFNLGLLTFFVGSLSAGIALFLR